jgi:hypothetical protein
MRGNQHQAANTPPPVSFVRQAAILWLRAVPGGSSLRGLDFLEFLQSETVRFDPGLQPTF